MRQRSDRLMDLAISPIDEAFKSVVGQGSGDAEVPQPEKRTIYLAHEIDEDLALAFIATLHRLVQEDTKDPITLIINAPGGDDVCGFGMYDALLAAKEEVPVIATIRGAAMSMAPVILQACTERRMGRNSYLMMHQSWGFTYYHSTLQAERLVRFMRMMEDHATRLLTERTVMTPEEFNEKIAVGDWYMGAREAKRLGFVDVIE